MRYSPVTHLKIDRYRTIKEGKVRSIFEIDDTRLLFVATDRISAFDVVMPTPIPGKGVILTQLSNFWFDKTSSIIANHLVSTEIDKYLKVSESEKWRLAGRTSIVRKAKIIPFEFVVRGYISGSMWNAYKVGKPLPGIDLPPDLKESEKLSEPIFTPTTKSDIGHDEPVSVDELKNAIGAELTHHIRDKAFSLYKFVAEYALDRNIIIADTKLEFGLIDDQVILADEAFTPDSSRFWPSEKYSSGAGQDSYDKQYLRDYLNAIHWNHKPPAPILPDDVVRLTQVKYLEAYKHLTGSDLKLEAWSRG